MAEDVKEERRGGARKGSGRRPVAPELQSVSRQINLYPPEWDAADALAKRLHITRSEVFRRALHFFKDFQK